MITVKDLFKSGTGSPVVVAPTDTVYRALQLMAENNVGSVVVSDGGHMVGIFTERDYCRKIILMGRSSLNTPIEEIMTKNMITVRPDQTLEECLELMSKYHIRHLPVEEGPWLEHLLRGTFILFFIPLVILFIRKVKFTDFEFWLVTGFTLVAIFSFGNERFREPAMPFVIGYVTPIAVEMLGRLRGMLAGERRPDQ